MVSAAQPGEALSLCVSHAHSAFCTRHCMCAGSPFLPQCLLHAPLPRALSFLTAGACDGALYARRCAGALCAWRRSAGEQMGMVEQAAAALAAIAHGSPDMQDAIIAANGVPMLLSVIRSGSAAGQEHAARAIRNTGERVESHGIIVECAAHERFSHSAPSPALATACVRACTLSSHRGAYATLYALCILLACCIDAAPSLCWWS